MNFDFSEILLEVVAQKASDLHITAGAPPMLRVRGSLVPIEGAAAAHADRHARDRLRDPQLLAAPAAGDRLADRLRLLDPGPRALPRQRLLPARHDRRGVPPDPDRDGPDREARPAAGHPRVRAQAARHRARHGPDRLGQVDDARLADQRDQRDARRAHHDDRGPDRVPPPPQAAASSTSASSAATRKTFAMALKAALRQDPDVILVGEMRDMETIGTALTAAETGHLVFATLHTQDAPQTVDRIIDVFPPRPAGPGPRAARDRPAGHRDPDAGPDRRRRRPRVAAEVLVPTAGRPQPDPRGQDPPDLLADPDRRGARDADDGRLARRASSAPGRITLAIAETRSSNPRSCASCHPRCRPGAAGRLAMAA